VLEIRDRFPEENGVYTGFRQGRDISEVTFAWGDEDEKE